MRRIVHTILLMPILMVATIGWPGEIQIEGYVTSTTNSSIFLLQRLPGGEILAELSDPLHRLAPDAGSPVVLLGSTGSSGFDGPLRIQVQAAYPGRWAYPVVGMRDVRNTDGDDWPDRIDSDDDNDGMSDLYEYGNGLNPLQADADEDLDRDGATNGEEEIAGTWANDPESVFRLTDTRPGPAPDATTLTWQSVVGRRYTILQSGRVTGPYEQLVADIAAQAGAAATSVTITNPEGQAFYRLEVRK